MLRDSLEAGREPAAVGVPEWAPGARESVEASQENMRRAQTRTYSISFSLAEIELRRQARERARLERQAARPPAKPNKRRQKGR